MSAATPEGRVKKAVKDVLREFGCWFFMPVQNGMGTMGIPDFIVCYKGLFIAIETKAPGRVKQTTPLQDRNIEAIRAAGGTAIVVDDAGPVRTLLETLRSQWWRD